jgi:hypothetical protein
MANVFAELRRRHSYRVSAAYAVVACVLLQIVNQRHAHDAGASLGRARPNASWTIPSARSKQA